MEKRIVRVFAVLVCPLLTAQTPPDRAPIPQTLDLEQAVALAIERNPTIAAAGNSVEMAEADIITAGLHPNPSLIVSAEDYPYFRSDAGPFFSNQEFGARFDYEIQTKNRLKLRQKAAEGAARREDASLEDVVRLLRLDVQTTFYQALLAQSNLQLAESILEKTDEVIALNRSRFEHGEISELELTRIEVERLRFADDVFQTRLELRNTKAALLTLLNAPDLGTSLEMDGLLDDAPDVGLELNTTPLQLYGIASTARPDLKAALAEIERSEAQNRFERAVTSPNITVGGGYKRNGRINSVVARMVIPLAIFNRNQGGVLRSGAEIRQAENLAAAARNRIELEIRQAYNALQVNRERVEYIRSQQLRQSEKASQVTLDAYRLGGAPVMDYLDAQRRYRDTIRVFNQALFDERVSRFVLAAAVGVGGR